MDSYGPEESDASFDEQLRMQTCTCQHNRKVEFEGEDVIQVLKMADHRKGPRNHARPIGEGVGGNMTKYVPKAKHLV